jgi:RecA-family ATPase
LFDVKDIDIPPLMYLLDKIIASGQVTFMFGQTGTYKSTLSLLFALSISSGKSTTFGNVKQGNVMWIDEEMGLSGLLSKIDMTADFMQLKDDKWKKHFHYKSMTDFNI